jgi:hypothetical protein
MRPQLQELAYIDAYLHGSLPEEAQMEAEIRMLWDQEWKCNVQQQQLAYQGLRQAGRQQLRRELNAIHDRLFS